MWELHYTSWDGVEHAVRVPEGTLRIGRTGENDLAIDDLALSARHCELELSGSDLRVRDLDSAAGTFLEGEMISEAVVGDGQTLNLGTFSITVRRVTERQSRPATQKPIRRPTPLQLDDGSISCQQHSDQRALFECDECYSLFCQVCFQSVEAKAPKCPECQVDLVSIDWSGLSRTKEDVLYDLLPDRVKTAMHYWQRFNQGNKD